MVARAGPGRFIYALSHWGAQATAAARDRGQAQRETCTERTIHNRIDRSMAAILREFLDEEMTVERIEEPAEKPTRHYRASWELDTGATEPEYPRAKINDPEPTRTRLRPCQIAVGCRRQGRPPDVAVRRAI